MQGPFLSGLGNGYKELRNSSIKSDVTRQQKALAFPRN